MKYGNGYDICGELSYSLYNSSGKKITKDEKFSSEFTIITKNVDSFRFSLLSEAQGTEISDHITLKI